MKILLAVFSIAIISFSALGQKTDYNEQMMREDKRAFDDFVRKSDADIRRVESRERFERKVINQFFQIKIKGDANKIENLLVDSLKNRGFVVRNQSASQLFFFPTDKTPQNKNSVFAPQNFSLIARFAENLKSTDISVSIFSRSRQPFSQRRAEALELKDELKSILKSIKREVENSH